MPEPPDLVTMPDDIVCLIYDNLGSMQDVLSLAQSRLRFVPIYLRYRQRFRKAQQERVCELVYEYLEWLVNNCEDEYPKPVVMAPKPGAELWTKDKEPFTLEVSYRLPFLAGDLEDIEEYMGWKPHSWHFDIDATDEDPEDTYFTARGREMYQAYKYGVEHRGMIALTAKAEIMLQPFSSKIYLPQCRIRSYRVIGLEEYVRAVSCPQQMRDRFVSGSMLIPLGEGRF